MADEKDSEVVGSGKRMGVRVSGTKEARKWLRYGNKRDMSVIGVMTCQREFATKPYRDGISERFPLKAKDLPT